MKRILLNLIAVFVLTVPHAHASGDLTVTGNINGNQNLSTNGNIWSNSGSSSPNYLTGWGLYSYGNTFIEPGPGFNLNIQPSFNSAYLYTSCNWMGSCSSYYSPPPSMLYVNMNKSVFYGSVGIGVSNPAYNLQVNGSFSANYKYFDIKDPRYDDEQKRLVHSALEGPEIGVYYRGEIALAKGYATVKLPDYFEALTRKENRTVLLTPKFKNDKETLCNLSASDVIDGSFSIRAFGASDLSACNHGVFWEVKAERSDTDKITVEQSRDDKPIKKESRFIQHDKTDKDNETGKNSK